MATLTIRNVPAPVHARLRRRAAANARSVEAEVREILQTGLGAPASDWRKELADIQAKARKALGEPRADELKRFVAERRADWGED